MPDVASLSALHPMNLPNRLTVARTPLSHRGLRRVDDDGLELKVARRVQTGDCRAAGVGVGAGVTPPGLLLFVAASITDYFDGAIARRHNLVTDFGKLMDPVADKVLMAAAFICLIPDHAIPAWAAIVIISREFLITGLRLLAA